jgi:hypothetical protein
MRFKHDIDVIRTSETLNWSFHCDSIGTEQALITTWLWFPDVALAETFLASGGVDLAARLRRLRNLLEALAITGRAGHFGRFAGFFHNNQMLDLFAPR